MIINDGDYNQSGCYSNRKPPMDKVNEIIINILATLQVLANNILNLLFQPFFTITSIIQGVYEVWAVPPVVNNNNVPTETSPIVVQYPSTNDGRPYPEEVEPPACEHHIGFKINTNEQQQIEEIKKQLNNNQ